MRLQPSARRPLAAALTGLVQAIPGRASRMRSATTSGPIAMDPDVHPKAITSILMSGTMSAAAAVMCPSSRRSDSTVPAVVLGTRLA